MEKRKKPIKTGTEVLHLVTLYIGQKIIIKYNRDAVVVSYDKYHDEYDIDYGPIIVCGVPSNKIVEKIKITKTIPN